MTIPTPLSNNCSVIPVVIVRREPWHHKARISGFCTILYCSTLLQLPHLSISPHLCPFGHLTLCHPAFCPVFCQPCDPVSLVLLPCSPLPLRSPLHPVALFSCTTLPLPPYALPLPLYFIPAAHLILCFTYTSIAPPPCALPLHCSHCFVLYPVPPLSCTPSHLIL